LHSAVTAADKDLHDSFTAFETELLRRLREQDKVIEVLRGDELHLKEDTRLPPLHYLTPSEPTARFVPVPTALLLVVLAGMRGYLAKCCVDVAGDLSTIIARSTTSTT